MIRRIIAWIVSPELRLETTVSQQRAEMIKILRGERQEMFQHAHKRIEDADERNREMRRELEDLRVAIHRKEFLHDCRISELLGANNAEVERRRIAERELAALKEKTP